MHISRIRRWRIVLLCLLWLAPLWNVAAQPALTFKRVTVNWPTIELYMTVGCDGSPGYDVTKKNFRIFENGEEMKNITLWCPDPSIRCAVSLGLVMDVSGSMRGTAMTSAKNSAHALVDMCDGVIDELMLLRAGAAPVLSLPFNTVKPWIHDAVDSCSAGGGSALYDGIYAAIEEMVTSGVNTCRAIIVFTDGGDNGSSRTPAEIISFANRHRIRIIAFTYDEYGPKTNMELIAQLCGGKFFNNPNAGQIAAIYQEISSAILFPGYQECIATYERDCADGSLRTVEMQLVDFCGGTDTKTKTYRAPLDSSSFRAFDVELPLTPLIGFLPAVVPIMVDGPDAMLQPFELTLRYDSTVVLTGTDVPPDALLHGVAHQIDQQPGRLTVRSTEPLRLNGRATLLEVAFRAARTADSLFTGVAIESMVIPTSCLLPRITNHPVVIVTRLLPFITATNTAFCAGDSVTLEANPGFVKYLWSTGATTQNIRIGEGGEYSVSVIDINGDTLHTSPVTIIRHELPRVGIAADGPLDFCRGKSINLFCTGDTAQASIRWSNGFSGKSINVSTSGKYWADIISPFGCPARSDTVEVTVSDLPVRVLPGYRIDLCPGDSVVLSVDGDYQDVKWKGKSSLTYTVYWRSYGTESVRAEVSDSSGCKGTSDAVTITMLRKKTPSVAPSGIVELCPGGELLLTTESVYVAYRWTTGETSESIIVRQPGLYFAEVTDDKGCRAWTDTVQVIGITEAHPRIQMWQSPIYCSTDTLLLDGGANYTAWRWSTGAETRTISVTESGTYWVEATAYGGCKGSSDTVIIAMDQVPSMFQPVVRGSLPLCPGDTVWLDGPADMADWQWNTGAHGRSLAVTQAGRYAVTVLTPGGCEAHSAIIDLSMAVIAPPVITRVRDVLSTVAARSWQWKLNDQPIPGATQQSLTVRSTGKYTVTIVDDHGCTLTSEPFVVNILGIGEAVVPDDLLLYPDPVNDWLHVVFPADSRNAHVTLVSLLGQVLAEQGTSGESNTRTMRIDLSALPAGVYLLQASAGEKWWVRKVVKR